MMEIDGRCKACAGAYNYGLLLQHGEESFSMSRLAGPQLNPDHSLIKSECQPCPLLCRRGCFVGGPNVFGQTDLPNGLINTTRLSIEAPAGKVGASIVFRATRKGVYGDHY